VKTIKASEFKAKCLALMDEVASSGEVVVITKNGEPVSKLVPFHDRLTSLYGLHRDSIRVVGDVIRPVTVEWDTDR
jgi:prevent-host-death family protein